MNLRLLSYLASLGFRTDLDTSAPVAERDAVQDDAAAEQTREDASNLKFVLAL